jgi:hypothetical protein
MGFEVQHIVAKVSLLNLDPSFPGAAGFNSTSWGTQQLDFPNLMQMVSRGMGGCYRNWHRGISGIFGVGFFMGALSKLKIGQFKHLFDRFGQEFTKVTIVDSFAPAHSALAGFWLRPDSFRRLPSGSSPLISLSNLEGGSVSLEFGYLHFFTPIYGYLRLFTHNSEKMFRWLPVQLGPSAKGRGSGVEGVKGIEQSLDVSVKTPCVLSPTYLKIDRAPTTVLT